MMSKTKNLRKMGKRRFMKNLSVLGLSPAVVGSMTKDNLEKITEDPSKEVPRLARLVHTNDEELKNNPHTKPEREPVYYTIPRDVWKDHVAPFKGARIMSCKNEFIRDDSIYTQVTTRTNGHSTERVIQIDYRKRRSSSGNVINRPSIDIHSLKEKIPSSIDVELSYGGKADTVEGIPVIINQRDIEEQTCWPDDDPYYNYDYQPNMPGGVTISCGGRATSGTSAYDNDTSQRVMLTAGHVGKPVDDVYQPCSEDSTSKVGSIVDSLEDGNFDVAEFDHYSGDGQQEVFQNYIGGDSGPNDLDLYIDGVVGWDTIVDNIHTSYELHQQGSTTGRDHGEIVCATTESCENNAQYRSIIVESTPDSGDSGGPYFEKLNGNALIAASHAFGGIDNDGDGIGEGEGTFIGEVESKFNLTI
jgi:hypothetical protein